MRSNILAMPAACLLLLFFSCNQNPSADNKDVVAVPVENLARATVADSALTASNETTQFKNEAPPRKPGQQPHIPTSSQPAANPDWERKIIKTANLSIEVKSFLTFTDRLHRLVHENGGYIAQEDQNQNLSRIENAVSIKVPVDRFDDLVQQLPADSDQLTEKKVNSQDVSMEVVDTRSRLETKKEVRERYLDLLKQTHNMSDIVSVQQEIDGIQEQMEAASGRISYLSHSAAFSTVNLKFFQVLNPGAIEKPTPPPSFLHKIKLSFLVGWEFLSTLGLALLSVWPLWLAAGLGYTTWRHYRTRLDKKPA